MGTMSDKITTLAELKERMAGFVAEREWEKYHLPKNLAMSLAIETAELMEHFQWADHGEVEAMMTDPEVRQEIADEMADVFSFLLSLSNATGIDLSKAFEEKMAKTEQKYPADQCKGHYSRKRKK